MFRLDNLEAFVDLVQQLQRFGEISSRHGHLLPNRARGNFEA